MARVKSVTLAATLDELHKAGFSPVWERGGRHIKIHAAGLPPITVSGSPSDGNAAHVARRAVRKIIAQSKLTPSRDSVIQTRHSNGARKWN